MQAKALLNPEAFTKVADEDSVLKLLAEQLM